MGTPLIDQSVSTPETVTSAHTLHKVMMKTHILHNNVKRKFIMALREMKETKGYIAIDFSNIAQYAQHYYKYSSSTTYEYTKVADALLELPLEVVKRVESEADKVTISLGEETPAVAEKRGRVPKEERDRANTPAITRKVLARDGP